MKKVLLAIFLFSAVLSAQDSAEELIEKFIETYKVDKSKAVDDLYSSNKWYEEIKPNIENLKKMAENLTEDVMGKFYGFELVDKTEFSSAYNIFTYLAKYERQPIRFVFQLYKPVDKWTVYSMSFDDSFNEEIKNVLMNKILNN